VDYLPTGRRHPVSEAADLRQPRTIGDKTMDDLLTGLPASADLRRAVAAIEDDHGAVEVSCSNAFREMVVFTPPHRQAICIEPYTCVTDAMNLKDGHISPGVTVLPSGKMWMASVELSRLGRSS
jgi:aldose 1-epimerase